VSLFSDDQGVKRPLPDRDADALLRGRPVEGEPALSGFVSELMARQETPVPNAALSALLEGGLVPDTSPVVMPTRRRSWRLPAQIALGGVASLSLVFGAASANALPAPAQAAVADVVEAVTPLHVPRPAAKPTPKPVVTPSPRPTATRAPNATPTDDRSGRGSRPSSTPSPHGSGNAGHGGQTSGGNGKGTDGHASGSGSGSTGSPSSGGNRGSGTGSSGSGSGSAGPGTGGSGSGSSGSGDRDGHDDGDSGSTGSDSTGSDSTSSDSTSSDGTSSDGPGSDRSGSGRAPEHGSAHR
jgi:hypothetical protein